MDVDNSQEGGEADYSLLPIVAIGNIYKYLDYNDIKAASGVSYNWRMAALSDSFYVSNTIVDVDLSEFNPKLISPVFRNFRLIKPDSQHLKTIADTCSDLVRELTLHEVTMLIADFCNILRRFENLQRLILTKCNIKYSKSGEQKEREVVEPMQNITSLTCEDCELEEDAFVTLLLAFPNLQYLKFSATFNDFEYQTRFRARARQRGEVNVRQDAMTSFIENTFAYLPPNLKEFHFMARSIGGLRRFREENIRNIEVPQFFNKLKLNKFTFNKCSSLSKTYLENVLKTQTNLVYLHLSELINHELFNHIIENLHSLEELSLQNCSFLNDADISKLSKFSNQLRVLDISNVIRAFHEMDYGHDFIDDHNDDIILSSKGIVNGIALRENKCLEELNLECIELYRDDVLQLIRNLPNLKVLNLNSQSTKRYEIDDLDIEYISNMLPNLRELKLRCLDKITNDSLINHLKKLKNLRSLDLSHISNVNDETLINGLHFANLKIFSLVECDHITRIGLTALSHNCPAIENLDLRNCRQIDDSTVITILESFHRLKSLDVRTCFIRRDKNAIEIAATNFQNIKEILI